MPVERYVIDVLVTHFAYIVMSRLYKITTGMNNFMILKFVMLFCLKEPFPENGYKESSS